MKRNLAAAALAACVLAAFTHTANARRIGVAARDSEDLRARAMRLHRQAIVVDTHADTPSRAIDGFDVSRRVPDGHVDLPRMREGGVGAQFFAAYVAARYAPDHAARRTLEMIDAIRHDMIERAPNDFVFATSVADIERAHREGRIAALIGVEGGHAIEDSLRVLRQFYNLGARYMTLTHVNTNDWADSSGDEPKHDGLTDFGRQVIREMNRLGMLVDVSHVSDKTFYDVIATSRAPVIASHSSVAAISHVPRNMKDDLIGRLAANGGVMMVNFSCDFVSQRYADAESARERDHAGEIKAIEERFKDDEIGAANEIATRWPIPRPTVADVADHFDYVKKLLGNVDHLGIGSDFDGISCAPSGLDDISKLPNLTMELIRRGYSDAELTKILGGNLLRVFREVEGARGKTEGS